MADAQYILTLRMTRNITKVINKEEDDVGDSSSLHLHLLFSMALMSYKVAKAPSNDLSAIKPAFHFKDHYPRLRQALFASIQCHFWNLTEHLVFLALADDDIELELK
jgi:hypothetical protein